jgi:hypothetical protein
MQEGVMNPVFRAGRIWAAVIALALSVAALIGVLGVTGRADAAAGETRRMTITAASLVPVDDDTDFYNGGMVMGPPDGGTFVAPLEFPAESVFVRRIVWYAWDNSTNAAVCVSVYRSRPAAAFEDDLGGICTDDDPADPARYTHRIFSTFTGYQAGYLWIGIGPGGSFYGATIEYEVR